jgi:hypothetical protein
VSAPAPAAAAAVSAAALRPPETVMRLDRMGSMFATRLSFMRVLLRRIAAERWRFDDPAFDMNAQGFGHCVMTVRTPRRAYSLVTFTRDLAPDKRTDRVIAEAWDSTFALFDGVPTADDVARLAANVPLQEAGRCRASELVLGRANKSMRLFAHVLDRLSAGTQPDAALVAEIGYLMRTTAVYGSGKFGCADREKTADRPELRAPFQAEMLAVYLFRRFTILWVERLARAQGGDRAVALSAELATALGIGNSTGLGMAPFLVKHPDLIHAWASARETALARVRALPTTDAETVAVFTALCDRARRHVGAWSVEDAIQSARIAALRDDLDDLCAYTRTLDPQQPDPWEAVFDHARAYSLEGQEMVVSLLLEPHGAVVDDLAETLSVVEDDRLDAAMTADTLRGLIRDHYAWALGGGDAAPEAVARFWYYSEEKLEPRLGRRGSDPGADREMPLAVARDVAALDAALSTEPADAPLAAFLTARPEHRHAVRRVQRAARCPYAEIREPLVAETMRPIDLLRFKLAFFGAAWFDPKSDYWTRITLFAGAPQPDALTPATAEGWAFPTPPVGA